MTGGGPRQPVVVGVGADEPDSDALAWAVTEAAVRAAPLRVVHVVPCRLVVDPCGVIPPVDGPPGVTATAAESVDAALARARWMAPGIPLSGRVLVGAPVGLLIEQSRDAGLLVLGGRAAGGAGERWAGRVSCRVAARAHCPVVVVRDRPRVPTSPSRPCVVVGVQASRSCVPALGFAFRAAAQRGVPLTAVHAWGPDVPVDIEGACGSPAVIEMEAREVLDRVLGPHRRRFPDVPVQRRVVCADPAAALVAASRGAALVVVGCRGLGPVRRRLTGSVSREVVRRALGPVVVVGADRTARTAPPEGPRPGSERATPTRSEWFRGRRTPGA